MSDRLASNQPLTTHPCMHSYEQGHCWLACVVDTISDTGVFSLRHTSPQLMVRFRSRCCGIAWRSWIKQHSNLVALTWARTSKANGPETEVGTVVVNQALQCEIAPDSNFNCILQPIHSSTGSLFYLATRNITLFIDQQLFLFCLIMKTNSNQYACICVYCLDAAYIVMQGDILILE
jgi:hypothetical protein